jgi:hypothetical protein
VVVTLGTESIATSPSGARFWRLGAAVRPRHDDDNRMRIDLFTGGQRPLHLRFGLWLAERHVGADLGPPTAVTFRPDLLGEDFRNYVLRSAHAAHGPWDKGHIEMFSAFVSRLNSCRF